MRSRERLKRPPLDRSGPLRSWTTLFGVAGFDASEADQNTTKGTTTAEAGLNDVVSRSVELGYRVIDEYVRQGQAAARRFTDRSYDTDAMTADAQELMTRMTQYASDFTALWLEFMQMGMGGAGRWPMPPPFNGLQPSAPADQATTATTPHAGDGTPPLRVKVAVTSPYPTEVALDLRTPGVGCRLVVQALRAVSGDESRIADVGLEHAGPDEPLTLWIRVAAGQPPGVYNGMIVNDETSVPVGTVSLRILPS